MKTINIKKRTPGNNIPGSLVNGKYHAFYRRELKSFRNAAYGIIYFFRNEYHAGIHFFAALLVLILCLVFPVTRIEFMLLVSSIALVWTCEMINTAIEKAMDFISLEKYEPIRIVKDVAAGAVLIASCAAVLIGAIVFIPKIFHI